MLAEGWNRTVRSVAYDATEPARAAAQEATAHAGDGWDAEVLAVLDDAGFDLGDVWRIIRPVIEGAAAPVVKSTGWLAPIVGGAISGILDAVGGALS